MPGIWALINLKCHITISTPALSCPYPERPSRSADVEWNRRRSLSEERMQMLRDQVWLAVVLWAVVHQIGKDDAFDAW